ncbi:macrophage mannose receptor 1-like isoform X2 [Channa argus]|uniref:macrophage mannose receptor 1-like isoform X2 n=1 Tax=Channa argus TaxID=215402 RepID=UPI00351FCB00
MDKILLDIIIAALGLFPVSSHAERQYHFIYEQKNLPEARSYCRDKYTDLATIETMEDMNRLTAMADLSQMIYTKDSHEAWIGLYDDVNSWRWSLADPRFYKPGEAENRIWSSGEPNNLNSKEQCTQIYNGLWFDQNCEDSLFSVCSNVSGSNVKFVLVTTSMTWTQAQTYCRTHYTDLASVRNQNENQNILGLVPSGQRVWIGLFRDSWKWFDGSSSSFMYWRTTTKEPNNTQKKETCVAANFAASGQWEDWKCDYRKAFICYSVVLFKRVVKVTLEKQSSSLNLNDPAVMDDSLKQLQLRLKDKGLNGDIRLSWVKQSDGKVFNAEQNTED